MPEAAHGLSTTAMIGLLCLVVGGCRDWLVFLPEEPLALVIERTSEKAPKIERTLLVMSSASKAQPRVDQFFTGAEARSDRWRTLLQQSRQWA